MTVIADASWVAALRDPADAHHVEAVANHRQLGAEVIVLAPLTLAECLVGPARQGVVQEAETALRAAFEISEDDDSAPRRWAMCRAETGLKLPDAIVLETARHEGIESVATFDTRLALASRKAGIRVIGHQRP